MVILQRAPVFAARPGQPPGQGIQACVLWIQIERLVQQLIRGFQIIACQRGADRALVGVEVFGVGLQYPIVDLRGVVVFLGIVVEARQRHQQPRIIGVHLQQRRQIVIGACKITFLAHQVGLTQAIGHAQIGQIECLLLGQATALHQIGHHHLELRVLSQLEQERGVLQAQPRIGIRRTGQRRADITQCPALVTDFGIGRGQCAQQFGGVVDLRFHPAQQFQRILDAAVPRINTGAFRLVTHPQPMLQLNHAGVTRRQRDLLHQLQRVIPALLFR